MKVKTFSNFITEKVALPAKTKTLGISRKEMPQVQTNDMPEFVKFLRSMKVNVKNEKINPDKLKATQNQFHIAKIQSLIDKIESGVYDNKSIMVSKDNYVIDGHHRWIAHKNIGADINIVRADVDAHQLIDLMHEFPKSFTKKLYESYDCVLLESGEACPVLTREHMNAFQKLVDRLFDKFGIDFEFTRHFRERMSDGRNNPCINLKELALMIQKIYKKKAAGQDVFAKHKDAEAVIKDAQTDLNMPVAVEYDRKNNELTVVAKTIMRKKAFRTPNPTIVV